MKILMINGSPRKEGNTFLALSEVAKGLKEYGLDDKEPERRGCSSTNA